jgi:D-alanine-D-alanine ligase
VIPIGIDKQGRWFLGQDVFTNSIEQNTVSSLTDDSHAWFAPQWIGCPTEKQLAKQPVQSAKASHFDVIFPVLHGTLCEDGTLQGLLEMANLPYVGCGVLSSAMGMDKDISKRIVSHAGIAVAPYLVIKQDAWKHNPKKYTQRVGDELSYPVFVKPANTGSSIGITKVKTPEQLTAAIEEAFRFDTKVLVEKALNIIELEVAVLESIEPGSDPIVSTVGEIKPRHEFYSYEAKYLDDNGAELIIPAKLPEGIAQSAQSAAKDIFIALECEGMARVDLFFDADTKQIIFNEINTIPGFTQISMYPKLMMASGMTYSALLTHLVQLAIKRHTQKRKLIRSYSN